MIALTLKLVSRLEHINTRRARYFLGTRSRAEQAHDPKDNGETHDLLGNVRAPSGQTDTPPKRKNENPRSCNQHSHECTVFRGYWVRIIILDETTAASRFDGPRRLDRPRSPSYPSVLQRSTQQAKADRRTLARSGAVLSTFRTDNGPFVLPRWNMLRSVCCGSVATIGTSHLPVITESTRQRGRTSLSTLESPCQSRRPGGGCRRRRSGGSGRRR